MAKATAKERGYFVGIHEAGETFEVPDGTESNSWFTVQSKKRAVEEPKDIEDMKAGELIAYAEEGGLDIGEMVPQMGAPKILAAVKAALALKAE